MFKPGQKKEIFIGERVLVVGAGKSGVAVSRFLAGKGAAVELTDLKSLGELDQNLTFDPGLNVKLSLGSYPCVGAGQYTMVVVSPGVPLTAPPVERARELDIPIVGELELAFSFVRAPVVAITGTNGKTTTTALVGEILKNAGRRVLVAGNIGQPLISEVERACDIIVLEVSSFQLETTCAFKPQVGAILNIMPDHLDRHHNMRNYAMVKARLFKKQDKQDFSILNYDDPQTRNLTSFCPGQVIFFSRKKKLAQGVFVHKGWITAVLGGQDAFIIPIRDLKIPGQHNLENALAAVACGRVLGVPVEFVAHSLKTFPGVAHRLEFVAQIDGVRYINDSKGTNPAASIKALQAFHEPVVLIAGGRNKGSDFQKFVRYMKEKVRVLVLLGESAKEIGSLAQREGIADIFYARSMEEAVYFAKKAARPGDLVLLSPACASWDMFKNFEERGELFKKIVQGYLPKA